MIWHVLLCRNAIVDTQRGGNEPAGDMCERWIARCTSDTLLCDLSNTG